MLLTAPLDSPLDGRPPMAALKLDTRLLPKVPACGGKEALGTSLRQRGGNRVELDGQQKQRWLLASAFPRATFL